MKETTIKAYALIGLITKQGLCNEIQLSLFLMASRLETEEWKKGEIIMIDDLYSDKFLNLED